MKKRHELYKVVSDKNEINAVKEWVGQMVALGLRGGSVMISITRPRRTLDQNDKFHKICRILEVTGVPFADKPRIITEWKTLLVSAHAVATFAEYGIPQELVVGIEGEPVQLRESTSKMDKARKSSLISYAQAYCDSQLAQGD